MPKNLSDVSQFETVAVPVGTDTATASSVETPLQILADRTRYLLDHRAIPQLNWIEPDDSAETGMTNVLAGCYSPYRQTFHFIDDDGRTCHSFHPGFAAVTAGGAGESFRDEAATPLSVLAWTASATWADICCHFSTSAREWRLAVSNSAAGQVAISNAIGTWAAAAGGIAGTVWWSCCFGATGWLIGGASGAISFSTNPVTTAFASQTSGLSNNVTRIANNRKPIGSPGPTYLAIDATGSLVSRSKNGTTWTATATGLGSAIVDLDWSEEGDRWVGVCADGRRCFSADDGITWTDDTTALEDMPTPIRMRLRCLEDGVACIAVQSTGGDIVLYVSSDDGETWDQAFHPLQYNQVLALSAGAGRFVTYGASGPLASRRGDRRGY